MYAQNGPKKGMEWSTSKRALLSQRNKGQRPLGIANNTVTVKDQPVPTYDVHIHRDGGGQTHPNSEIGSKQSGTAESGRRTRSEFYRRKASESMPHAVTHGHNIWDPSLYIYCHTTGILGNSRGGDH